MLSDRDQSSVEVGLSGIDLIAEAKDLYAGWIYLPISFGRAVYRVQSQP